MMELRAQDLGLSDFRGFRVQEGETFRGSVGFMIWGPGL